MIKVIQKFHSFFISLLITFKVAFFYVLDIKFLYQKFVGHISTFFMNFEAVRSANGSKNKRKRSIYTVCFLELNYIYPRRLGPLFSLKKLKYVYLFNSSRTIHIH
jgi:hypothetical protein